MQKLHGTAAIRMGALCYAKHGRTLDALHSFLDACVGVRRVELRRRLRELQIEVAPNGRLSLKNVLPLWHDCFPVRSACEQYNEGGSAA